jgi:hypothetical protein
MKYMRPGYSTMPLSNIQKGAIGQYAFLAIAMVTGNGQLEAYVPAADNEGRDAEVRRHLSRLAGIGIQVKMAFRAFTIHGCNFLSFRCGIERSRIQNDPRLWFLLGYYDSRRLGLHDPVYLVPASVFHRLARRRTKGGGRDILVVEVSLDPGSHDEWSLYRVVLKELGKRLLEIIDSQKLARLGRLEPLPSDTLLIGRRGRGRTTTRLQRAA